MSPFWPLLQIAFICIQGILLLGYAYLVFEIVRARKRSGTSMPKLWMNVVMGNIIFILAGILFMLMVTI